MFVPDQLIRPTSAGYVWIAAAARDDDGTFEEDYGMSLNAASALWIAAGVLGWSSASEGNRRVNERRTARLELQLPASEDSATSVDG